MSNETRSCTSCSSESPNFHKFVRVAQNVAESAKKEGGFVYERGMHAYQILFKEAEVQPFFNKIRSKLANGQGGTVLTKALKSSTKEPNNHDIWEALVCSLQFNGVDFEHRYQVLPCAQEDTESLWEYSFEETIVLGHTVLVVPVMQHYGPLMPKLDLNGPTQKFETAQPLLAVGLIGDCVRGKLWDDLNKKAELGDAEAESNRALMLNPQRLQQKMRAVVQAILCACRISKCCLNFDATLVGAGAFGGNARTLAQPFMDSLNGLPITSDDKMNLFLFPPPQPEDLNLSMLSYGANLNPREGVGSMPVAVDTTVRVVMFGSDPISLLPHGVLNRVVSLEGQLSHATDLHMRFRGAPGKFMRVRVPPGPAWKTPAAFFAQEPEFKMESGYNTVRFVTDYDLKFRIGITEEQQDQERTPRASRSPSRRVALAPHDLPKADRWIEAGCLDNKEQAEHAWLVARVAASSVQCKLGLQEAPQSWNGDAFEGWHLEMEEVEDYPVQRGSLVRVYSQSSDVWVAAEVTDVALGVATVEYGVDGYQHRKTLHPFSGHLRQRNAQSGE